ncbi:MAG: hypothetical protein QNJ11_05555 [Woeseiaceae bacterium]|nr:hypothetical protein [Woeseiaceae bacterium]
MRSLEFADRIAMYEQHFGLEKRPFLAKATGVDVFVGPQTAQTMAGLKKALSAQDAVVAVSGPAGVGKTTLVAKALDALRDSHRTVRIGRMQLDGTDALELLLEELGTGELPRGPIRQFTAFRELLEQLESSGKRLVIIIEDASRAGIETLAEVEALTAADAGESGGAAIVIMGDVSIADLLSDPRLARLSQRTRQRLTIDPLSLAELRGYLMHCFRSSGGDFHIAFDDKSAEVLHSLSGGVPRVANYVAEAALSAAAADGVSPVSAETVARIARDEFGLEPAFEALDSAPSATPGPEPEPALGAETMPEPATVAEPVIDVEPETIPEPELEPIHEAAAEIEPLSQAAPVPEPDPLPVPETESEPDPLPVLETEPEPDPLPVLDAEPEPEPLPVLEADSQPAADEEPEPVDADPVIVFSDTTEDAALRDEKEIPELINDTLPDLEVLAPGVIAEEPTETELPVLNVRPAPEPEPESSPEQDPQPIAEVEPEPQHEPVLEIEPAPEPEVQPEPMLELEPDLEPEPELEPEPAVEPPIGMPTDAAPVLTLELADDDVPEWDRDPTLAELRPDLDALEKAMAYAHGESEDEEQVEAAHDDDPELELEELPQITLDSAIEENIENTLIDEPDAGDVTSPVAPASAQEPGKSRRADGEIEKIAAELARAKTIEDVGDTLAETLFGDEINMIAAQVIAAGPAESANDAGLFDTQRAQLAQAAGSPASAAGPDDSTNAREPILQDAVEVSLESPEIVSSGLDLSASQRLKTVRALNADVQPPPRESGNDPVPDVSAREVPAPEPIEEQIDTSITQTLKALKVASPVADATENEEPEEKKKGGFFSRFRRS